MTSKLSQSTLDALADAETLYQYCSLRARIERGLHQFEFGVPMPENIRLINLHDAEFKPCPEHYGLSYTVETHYKRARSCAHFAFLAVPGLRGDK